MSSQALYLLIYFVVLLLLDAFYLSKHPLIFAGVIRIQNKLVRYFMTAFSVMVSFSLIFLPAVIYHYFMKNGGLSKSLVYALGALAYVLGALWVAHKKKKGKGQ